ncbi:recombinase family protein [Lactobacillus sp. AN1001]
MKIALYLRVSTLEQAESGYSLEEQEDKLRKYCEAKDWDVVHVYRDPGFSGSTLNRPSMQQLISDVGAGLFEGVLVYKLDRLSRSQKDTLHLIEDVFNAHNVSFISMSENFDTSTPFGKAMIGILSVFAQLEREQIKERMQMGKVGRAKTGKAMNWSNPPFGYNYDEANEAYKVDDLKARIVKDIYKDYLSGTSITKIVDKLNETGHIGKPKAWSFSTLRAVLSNETYTGVTVWKGNAYPGSHKAIISKKMFDRTQKELSRRQRLYAEISNPRPFQAQYMLSGIIRCAYCGNIYVIDTRKNKKLGKYHIYRCASKSRSKTPQEQKDKCLSMVTYQMKDLEHRVISEIRKLQVDNSLIDRYKTETVDTTPLKNELERINKQQAKLVDLYLIDGNLPLEKVKEKSHELERQRQNIQHQLNQINEPPLSVSEAKELLATDDITTLSYESQKVLVNKLIREITISNDSMNINWNFTL